MDPRPSRNDLNWIAVLFVLCVALFARDLFLGQTLALPDLYAQNNPRHAYLADSLRQGRVPLWCPLVETGSPFAADGATGTFYPLSLIFLLAPVGLATSIFIALHLFIAAAGMYLLCRRFGATAEAAALGAVVFALCGTQLAHVEHTMHLSETAWLPLALLLVDIAVSSPGFRRVIPAAAVLAIMMTPAFPPVLLYALPALALFVLFRRDAGLRRFAVFAFVCILAGVFAAIPLGLTYRQVLASSHRGGVEWFLSGSFNPLYLAQSLFPFIFGIQYTRYSWWPEPGMECVFYLGVIPLALAALSFFGPKRWWRPCAVLLIALGLFLALGKFNPLYRFLYEIPLLGMARVPARAMLLVAFPAALLAAWGLHAFPGIARERFLRRPESRLLARLSVLLWVAAAGAALAHFAPAVLPNLLTSLTRLFIRFQGGTLPFDFYLEKVSGLYALWTRDALFASGSLAVLLGVMRLAGSKKMDAAVARRALLAVACLDLLLFARTLLPSVPRAAMEAPPASVKFLAKQNKAFRVYSWKTEALWAKSCGPRGIADAKCLMAVRSALPLDVPLQYGIPTIGGYASIPLRSYMELYAWPSVRKGAPPPTKSDPPQLDPVIHRRILSLLGVRYVLTSEILPEPYKAVFRDSVLNVYENPDALPRAWIVPHDFVVPAPADGLCL